MADQTLARMFWERVERNGDRPVQLVKTGDRWTEVSWRALGEEVRDVGRPRVGPFPGRDDIGQPIQDVVHGR